MATLGQGTILLHWNFKTCQWQTEMDFAVDGGSTYGMQWYALPFQIMYDSPNTFKFWGGLPVGGNGSVIKIAGNSNININGGNIDSDKHYNPNIRGNAVAQSGNINLDFNSELRFDPNKKMSLMTDSKTRNPFVVYDGGCMHFTAIQSAQGLGGAWNG